MDENELRRKMQAGELAANNGTVMRTLAIAGCDFKFLKLKSLLLALAGGMDRMALCSSINYLADSGYLQVRCIEDKAPSSVSDAELEDLEVKLTPRGIQLPEHRAPEQKSYQPHHRCHDDRYEPPCPGVERHCGFLRKYKKR